MTLILKQNKKSKVTLIKKQSEYYLGSGVEFINFYK